MPDDTGHLQCMEVWGGNTAVDTGVVMAGLDAWAYARPWHGAIAGGDVHYVSSCATGRITRLLVADVSGHGDAVAETASALRRLMRELINRIRPDHVFGALNRAFTDLVEEGGFATAVIATFYAPTHELTLCNAGHPPPLLRSGRDGTWSYLQDDTEPAGPRGGSPANVPLGVIDATQYDVHARRLQVGDLVVLYSDSLTDAGAPEGGRLGQEGLLEVVRGIEEPDPQAFARALLDRVNAETIDDDLTLLLFRPNGLFRGVPFHVRLLAPVRTLVDMLRHRDTRGMPEMSVRAIGGALSGRLAERTER